MKKLSRLARLGGLTSRVGSSYLGQQLKGAFQDRDTARQELDQTHRKNAERVVQTMGKLKGAAMKVGKNLAQVVEGMDLPPEVGSMLRTLNDKAEPVPFEDIRRQIEASLGPTLEELYASVDPVPLGTASLAQAHAATLHDGREVVIKVLHDGVEDHVDADLGALKSMFITGRVLNRSKAELEDLFAEISARLNEELDYYQEAANIEMFRRNFADHPGLKMPATHPTLCTDRVLTMDRMHGLTLEQWLPTASAKARQDAGMNLAMLFFESIYRHRALHADPHEGNYLFQPDGTVALLDFGCVKRFDEHWLCTYARLADACIAGERGAAIPLLREIGGLVGEEPAAEDLLWEFIEVLAHPFRHGRYTAGGAEDPTHQDLKKVLPRFLRYPQIRTPREMVFLHRSLGGTYGMLAKLRVRADWGELASTYHQLAIDRAEGRL